MASSSRGATERFPFLERDRPSLAHESAQRGPAVTIVTPAVATRHCTGTEYEPRLRGAGTTACRETGDRMSLITQPLRDEHRELLTHVGHVRQLGDAAGRVPPAELQARLGAVVTFLGRRVVPHMRAEEAALYPAVDRLIGAGATATMSRDHAEVTRLVDALASLRDAHSDRALDDAALTSVRELSYGLAAVLTLHVAKEDDLYLALLDRSLSAEEGRALLAKIEHAGTQSMTGEATG